MVSFCHAVAAQPAHAGLSCIGSRVWTQESPELLGAAEEDDAFGQTLVTGDFNGDGAADLVISENLNFGSDFDSGAVQVLLSQPGVGLTGDDSLIIDGLIGGGDGTQAGERFGAALATGDFNDDGFDDLAIGIPRQAVGGAAGAGEVVVLRGSASGIQLAQPMRWNQDSAGVVETAEAGDEFGGALAAGDFDGDGFDDLAIGAAREDLASVDGTDHGVVHVLHGSITGLTVLGSQFWSQDSSGIAGAAESGDTFGRPLVTADFDGDGFDDLAIGVALEDLEGAVDAGFVHVLDGSDDGLSGSGSHDFAQDDSGGVREAGDQFGRRLGTGDFNGDGYADLVVGAPFEDREENGTEIDAGAVSVFFGSLSGPIAAGAWHREGSVDIGVGEQFGFSVAGGDFDGDEFDDLIIGRPFATDFVFQTGTAVVLRGSAAGTFTQGGGIFRQERGGCAGDSEVESMQAAALAVGDFDADGFSDLVIGAPGSTVEGHGGAGSILVLRGSLFSDGFEPGGPCTWTGTGFPGC